MGTLNPEAETCGKLYVAGILLSRPVPERSLSETKLDHVAETRRRARCTFRVQKFEGFSVFGASGF